MSRLLVLLIGLLVIASALGRLCTPEDNRLMKMCTAEIMMGCVCYTNGTCEQRLCNICSDCGRPNIVSVDYGKCPVQVEKSAIISKDLGN